MVNLVPSERFLIVAYQLCARLVSATASENIFEGVLLSVVQRMVYDYPFHSLAHLIALKNGSSKDKTSVAG
jgi:hypothetical protein